MQEKVIIDYFINYY